MRYAFIADIHGNLEALDAVFADINNERIDAVYCLGDVVGYYADPNECARLVREKVQGTIAGNHDYAALGRIDIRATFTFYACVAIEWTQKKLSTETRAFLESLPLTMTIGDSILLTHSTPQNPDNWDYLFADNDDLVWEAFDSFHQRICFNAHTHFPLFMCLQGDRVVLRRDKLFRLEAGDRYIVNVGSVGQPRDNDSRSCYTIYDTNTQEVAFKRVKYDVLATQEKIKKNELPNFLAIRLEEGR